MSDETSHALGQLSNPTLEFYLEMMSGTETPPIFHAWSLLSAASAALTRRKYFQLGAVRIYPNQYIMLVGPPGVRKSSGLSFARQLLDDIKELRYGPNNTAGRAQGLIAAMQGVTKSEKEEDAAFAEALASAGASMNFGIGDLEDEASAQHNLDKHAVYVSESELSGFLGRNMDEFITFLGDIWDNPSSYKYQIKRETVEVFNPCLNLIGGITPMHITTYLPQQAIGQGFSSRVLMAYADEAKKVPWPEPISDEAMREMRVVLRGIFEMQEGAFTIEAGVKEAVSEIYYYKLPIEDVRFIHYAERRQAHLLKVAMALAALRLSTEISVLDIRDAHALLVITEQRMPEALGEYGLSPAALARARVAELLKNSAEPLTVIRIIMAVGSDVKKADVQQALMDMAENGQIIEVTLRDPSGTIRAGYTWPRSSNPFKRNQEVEVSYVLDETASADAKPEARRKSVTESLAEIADTPKQERVSEEVLRETAARAEAADKAATAGDTKQLSEQGYSSVAEKMKALKEKSKGLDL